jgi:hypothetical protein
MIPQNFFGRLRSFYPKSTLPMPVQMSNYPIADIRDPPKRIFAFWISPVVAERRLFRREVHLPFCAT